MKNLLSSVDKNSYCGSAVCRNSVEERVKQLQAVCGKILCGQVLCGQCEYVQGAYNLTAENIGNADYGENPKVNLATGRLIYEQSGLTMGGGTYSIGISIIYNSAQNVNANFCGAGWKLNVNQKLIYDNGTYKYIDAKGEINTFVLYDTDNQRYYNEIDAEQILSVPSEGQAYITYGIGNKIFFNSDGNVSRMVSGINATIAKAFDYDDKGRIIRIYDERLKFADSIRTFFAFEYYGSGMLKSVTAYDKYKIKKAAEIYEYNYGDTIKLINIKRVAFNSNGVEIGVKNVKEFSYYDDGYLKAIVDTETRSASVLRYGEFKEITETCIGVVQVNSVSLGAGLDSGNIFANSGQAVTQSTDDSVVINGGAFIEKAKNTYTYYSSGGKVYETDLKNQDNIVTAFYLDSKYHITSSFERSDFNIKTLKKESGKFLNFYSYVNYSQSGQLINGKPTYTSRQFAVSFNEGFNLSHYTKNDNKFFECSFWLKHSLDEERLKIKYEYKLGADSSYRTEYAWINGRAKDAWQKASVILKLDKDGSGNYNSSSFTACRITLCYASGESAGTFVISNLCFNPAPKVTISLRNGGYTFPLNTITRFYSAALNCTYEIENFQAATDTYLTENDVIRSLMHKFGKGNKQGGRKYFDIICNDGTKRLANARGLVFETDSGTCNLSDDSWPVVTETIFSTNKVLVNQYYHFEEDKFTLTSNNYYRENGLDGENSENDQTTSNTEIYNYKGQKLSVKDEYGITTHYEYDSYGQLLRTKNVANDGTVGEVNEVKYDENGENVKTIMGGFASSDFAYSSPFENVEKVTRNTYNSALNTYDNTENITKTKYGAFNDRITYVEQYEGSNKQARNEITYENGRIRTVSDGYVKYGAKYDFINDKMEYTRFRYNDEIVLQTDTIEKSGTNKIYTSAFLGDTGENISTKVDKYGCVQSFTEGNTSQATYMYTLGNECSAAQKISTVYDNYEGKTTTYNYDKYNNLYGWKKGNNHLTVEQIAAGDTKYVFGENEKYCTRVLYDSEKIFSSRITSTTVAYDPNNDSDDDFEDISEFQKSYEYDKLGRLKKKVGASSKQQSYTYKTLASGNTGIPESTDFNYKHYIKVGNAINILETVFSGENYKYDSRGNLKYISSSASQIRYLTGKEDSDGTAKVSESQTKSYTYDWMNRLLTENDSIFGDKKYSYDNLGRISAVETEGLTKSRVYNDYGHLQFFDGAEYYYDGMGNRSRKAYRGRVTQYRYTRGNMLAGIGEETKYSYNIEGVRFRKEVNGTTTEYYLDGNKILGEDRSDGKKLRYFYDIDGLCGIRYNNKNYVVVRNAYGDINTILDGDNIVVQYFYDAWGNCVIKQFNDTEDIGNVNPFRWKGHYYDVESGLYYANGSYYDPEVGLHVDAAAVSSLIDNAFEVFGLDMNGIMCDNILAYLPYAYSVFTTLELNANPLYDPDYNKPWWELAWRAVVNWFASVVKWFNELDIGIKIGIGIVLLALACIITAAVTIGTGGTGTAALAAVGNVLMQFAIGVVSMAAISVVIAAVSGEDIVDSLTQGIADGIFWGGVFAFVSAGVNAIKEGVRGIKIGNEPFSTGWPPNNGFDGKPKKVTLKRGTVIDRYGYENGYFASPKGTPFEMRSLPSNFINRPYHTYTVQKTVEVMSGRIAPWFGQPGGGVQYMFFQSIESLIKSGILK